MEIRSENAIDLPTESRELRVLMVHGTWARGFFRPTPCNPKSPRWFEQGSAFSTTLLKLIEGLGVHPTLEEPLLWSGRNALLHRAEAAQRLADRLKAMPPVPCLVVSHSHGGNVVLRALDELDGEHIERLRVVTMATPFVELFLPKPGARNYERLQLAALLLLAAIQIVNIRWIVPGVPFLLSTAVAAVLGVIFAMVFSAERSETQAILRYEACLATRLKVGAGYFQFKDRVPHTLIVRGVEDEASLLIASAAALGRVVQIGRDISHRLWHMKFRALWIGAGVLAASILVLLAYGWAYGPEALFGSSIPHRIRVFGLVSSALLVGVPSALSGLAVLARMGCGIAAGRELFWLPNLEVSTSTAPDMNFGLFANWRRAMRVVTVPRQGRVLQHIRHSIYNDPDVFVAMMPWLTEALQPGSFDKAADTTSGRQG
jgi:hypothetical protein